MNIEIKCDDTDAARLIKVFAGAKKHWREMATDGMRVGFPENWIKESLDLCSMADRLEVQMTKRIVGND